ncbi:MAG TPA: ATP-binding cassette domain-containing protein [Acholeplasmataceae bacterium]|jgi:zinc transport system ATP-binding protein|nr:ATP-binding cassette domain-containing protein [Acholeplasmataceae bacterium]
MRVTVNDLTYAYTQKPVLSHVSFTLASGDFLTVIGQNGSGKSTLIKCLLGILKVPDETIFLDDVDINNLKRLYNVGYVPQKSEFNYEFPITVKELLSSAFHQIRKNSHYNNVINQLDLNRFYHENINNLSGGQLQRVFIARALINDPKLLVLDEPTVGVDTININVFIEILRKLKEQNITIILITHDRHLAEDLTDYYLELDEFLNYSFYKVGENK